MRDGDLTGPHCEAGMSASQLVSGGRNMREGRPGRRGAARPQRGCGREGAAVMTTGGGGSKQMSTSWQTGSERSSRWTSRSTVGLQSHREAQQNNGEAVRVMSDESPDGVSSPDHLAPTFQ